MLEYKPGLLFPSWLSKPSFKIRLAFKWDWRLFMPYHADSWLRGAHSIVCNTMASFKFLPPP